MIDEHFSLQNEQLDKPQIQKQDNLFVKKILSNNNLAITQFLGDTANWDMMETPHFVHSKDIIPYLRADIDWDYYEVQYENQPGDEFYDETGKAQKGLKNDAKVSKHCVKIAKNNPNVFWFTTDNLPKLEPMSPQQHELYTPIDPFLVNHGIVKQIKTQILKNYQKNLKHMQKLLGSCLTHSEQYTLFHTLKKTNNIKLLKKLGF